jgi:hypothetical protein
MTSRGQATRSAGRVGVGPTVRRVLPPQHGAWAFLALPVLLATAVPPRSWVQAVVAATWVVAYPLSYFALGMARSRRRARFVRPLLGWLAAVLVLGGVAAVARPWLLWVALAFLLLSLVHLGFARRNDERALANDALFVVECSAMVPVVWAAAGPRTWLPPPPADVPVQVWLLTAVCALVLLGSTLHVKSLIRERRDPRYARASRRFAAASVAVGAGIAVVWGLPSGAWLLVGFVTLAARSLLLTPEHVRRPGTVGLVELAAFVTVVAGAWLA